MNNTKIDLRPFLYTFEKNPRRPDVYDLVDGPEPTNLNYIRIGPPRREYFKKRNINHVIESHKDDHRIFFSGLFPIEQNWYFGDTINSETNSRHLIAVRFLNNHTTVNLYVYPFDLESNKKRVKFLREEIRKGRR